MTNFSGVPAFHETVLPLFTNLYGGIVPDSWYNNNSNAYYDI